MGQDDPFPPPRLNGRCRFSEGTFAGMRGNGRDAPMPAVRQLTPRSQRFDRKPQFPHAPPAIDAVSSMLYPSTAAVSLCASFRAVVAA